MEWSNYGKLRTPIHYNLNADSSINNLRISFFWRPWIDKILIKDMFHWIYHLDNTPNFILFGIYISVNEINFFSALSL
jgi:hypothetical protein